MNVLIIEDDPEIVAVVRNGLEEAGFCVESALSGDEGLRKAAAGDFSVIILDLMLSGMDGFTILRELKAKGIKTPVLVASARQSVQDKVSCLDAGCDDYITKPFSFPELLARIRALARRAAGHVADNQVLSSEGVRLDMLKREAERNGREISLKPKEFALLKYLMENAGNAVTRAMIMEHVWGYNFDPGTKVIDVYICQLREKVDMEGEDKLIQTVRGTGYAFRRV
ncbi:MAG: response regulator transcription factor [Humidesulfovibrio sp.]|nr:response regulator transcription factor [Humidesulfovibrio sp.]